MVQVVTMFFPFSKSLGILGVIIVLTVYSNESIFYFLLYFSVLCRPTINYSFTYIYVIVITPVSSYFTAGSLRLSLLILQRLFTF